MFNNGLTAGCQSPGGSLKFCPATKLTRVMASVFALRMIHGVTYGAVGGIPLPAATGTMFADMIETNPDPLKWNWETAWAEDAYTEGLLPNCGIQVGGAQDGKPKFCPNTSIDRAWAAYIVVIAKDLPLP